MPGFSFSARIPLVGTPDYGAALDRIVEASPTSLVELLLEVVEPLGAWDLGVYLVDFQGLVLQPLSLSGQPTEPIVAEEEVAGSMAGRAFQSGEPVTAVRDDGIRVWVPLVERGERTGVLAVTLAQVDESLMAECVRLGRFAGLLVRAFARMSDLMHLQRRRRSMTLAASMQWDLLPPLTVRCSHALACGRLEPAYEIAGDAFDYSIDERYLHSAIFDAMGHGVESTLMTTLAVGAYRHARRDGSPPAAAHRATDEAVTAHCMEEAFVTGSIIRLELETGILEWTNAGHPQPLLLRGHQVIGPLACAASLPFGLGGECRSVASEALEPGDSVLFFTDGITEGRSHAGEAFGTDRLADLWSLHTGSGLLPDEILRRLVEAVTGFNAGKLRDDASLLQISWFGPTGSHG